jgi:putative transposase
VTGKLPERHHRELKARWWRVLDDAAAVADARRGLQAIIADNRTAYPSAMAVIERHLDALVAHPRWPTEHRKRIRSTDLLERTLVEVRRRTKVIGRFPGKTSALSPIWAVLELSNRGCARRPHDPKIRRREGTPPPPPAAQQHRGGDRRQASTPERKLRPHFHPDNGTPPRSGRPNGGRLAAGPPTHTVWRPGGAKPTTSGGLPDPWTVLPRGDSTWAVSGS